MVEKIAVLTVFHSVPIDRGSEEQVVGVDHATHGRYHTKALLMIDERHERGGMAPEGTSLERARGGCIGGNERLIKLGTVKHIAAFRRNRVAAYIGRVDL